MGKIYNALKRAEKESKTIREKRQIFAHNRDNALPETNNESKQIKSYEQKEQVKDIQHITDKTKLPDLKLIPDGVAPKKKETKKSSFLSIFKKAERDITPGLLTNRNLFTIQDPHSMAAEQYRILRARILSFGKAKNIKTILVTSCLPEEGKSTVSSNLAICMANGINEHALLIDCDLRRPTIHSIFGLNRDAGLSNYLNDDISLPQTLNKTEVKRLTLISAGTPPGNPSELLSSQKMKDLIEEVRARYDDRYIIFDSTPVHQTPDPTILAHHVDGIILVVKAGKTNREIITKTLASLGREKILGVVFNMAREPVKSYYHNYDYYYSTQ